MKTGEGSLGFEGFKIKEVMILNFKYPGLYFIYRIPNLEITKRIGLHEGWRLTEILNSI